MISFTNITKRISTENKLGVRVQTSAAIAVTWTEKDKLVEVSDWPELVQSQTCVIQYFCRLQEGPGQDLNK